MPTIVPPIEFMPIEPLPALSERERIHAAALTAISLYQLGDSNITISDEDKNIARDAFINERDLTDSEKEKAGIVLHLEALLDKYDHDFLEEANRLRNFVVNRLMEETEDDKKSLKALELLGKITEVGLFTERKEILITHRTVEDLEKEVEDALTILLKPEDVVIEKTITEKPKLKKYSSDIDVDDML